MQSVQYSTICLETGNKLPFYVSIQASSLLWAEIREGYALFVNFSGIKLYCP